MKKLTFEHWVDYVRGVTPPDQSNRMSALLETGDPVATNLHRLATGLAEATPWLAGPAAPRDVLQRALSVFVPVEVHSVWGFPVLPVRTLFDSLLEPQPAGLRTQGALHRETIHQAGEYQLSLRLEQEPGSEVMALIGQILPNENVNDAVSHRPVFVFQKDKLVARTLSTDNGEFQLEFSGRQPLRLVLALSQPDRRIELDLEPVSGAKKASKPNRRSPKSN